MANLARWWQAKSIRAQVVCCMLLAAIVPMVLFAAAYSALVIGGANAPIPASLSAVDSAPRVVKLAQLSADPTALGATSARAELLRVTAPTVLSTAVLWITTAVICSIGVIALGLRVGGRVARDADALAKWAAAQGDVHRPLDPAPAVGSLEFQRMCDAFSRLFTSRTSANEAVQEEVAKVVADTASAMPQLDRLTHFPNRVAAHEEIAKRIENAQQEGTKFAVALVDLEGFSAINERYGYSAGDMVLCAAARRLARVLRPDDFVARFGADEFLVLVDGVTDEFNDVRLCDRLLIQGLARPDATESWQRSIAAKIGVSIYPDTAQDAYSLVANADRVAHEAKRKTAPTSSNVSKLAQELVQTSASEN